MRLSREAGSILGQTSIGMLALRAGHGHRGAPLVNPAVFSSAAGSLWMTTSRYAAKTIIARRDPRAAFLVDAGTQALLVRGALEIFDPLSLSSQVRAVLDGPGFLLGMAGYAFRNSPFVAGYALDLTSLPREWMPYNRVVLRLHMSHAEIIETEPFPPAQAARVPAVPAEVSKRLAGVARAYACWIDGAVPVIAPAYWESEGGLVTVAVPNRRPRPTSPGALVIESHHRFRPSQMVGACLRGTFGSAIDAEAIGERYGLPASAMPTALPLRVERVTAWRGFQVTTTVPRSARHLRIAEA